MLGVEVSVAWHPITLDFWQYAKEVEMCCRYFVENCFFNLVSWSFVANMNSFKHMLKYDHCFSVSLVSCFRRTCRTLYIPVMLYYTKFSYLAIRNIFTVLEFTLSLIAIVYCSVHVVTFFLGVA